MEKSKIFQKIKIKFFLILKKLKKIWNYIFFIFFKISKKSKI